ncbi:hypothetical protein [uncultured Roseibium sp.]|uniref:hypothetical protein n=1 Tax=uncultured Roseibium sp. TaxID=1936171 RepID=UPI002620CB27|nr:hypothetical protein [uncultured Roseibium sp.]
MWWLKSLIDIPGALADAYAARESAKTERERIRWDERVRKLEARKESILQAQKDPYERWVRIGFAFPFVVYINKLVLWDKVLGLGATDPLSADLTQIMMIVIGGYFVDTVVRRVMRR